MAVHDASFELRTGLTGLLGPNGAGKSSLLTCLAGIAPWDRGTVTICGIDLARHPREARRSIGFMPERVSLPTEMRVVEYLGFVAKVKGINRAARGAAIDTTLERCGLDGVRTRVVGNLSKGYRQRVGLAQALLGEPPLVILDEPTAGLDPLNILEIRDVLQDYASDRSVLVSTHHLPDARLMCSRIIVMAQGQILFDGAPALMAVSGSERVRVRLRMLDDAGAPALAPGMELVHCEHGNGETVVVLDAIDEHAVASLVEQLSQHRKLVSVEPTIDLLEAAFRRAVLAAASQDVTP